MVNSKSKAAAVDRAADNASPDLIIETRGEDGARETMVVQFKFSEKWGQLVVAGGFTSIPNYLLSINQFLDERLRLSSTELVVLLQILSYWWHKDRMPFPSKSTIAKRLHLSDRQVQRAISGLERKNFINRVARSSSNRGRSSNEYDLSVLVEKVRSIAELHPAPAVLQQAAGRVARRTGRGPSRRAEQTAHSDRSSPVGITEPS